MSKKKILITWPLPAAVMARARETYDVIAHGDDPKITIDEMLDLSVHSVREAGLVTPGKMVALTACIHKLLIILNAMVRDGTLWQAPATA